MFLRRWASSTMSMAQVTAPRNDWKENQHDTISKIKHYIKFSKYLDTSNLVYRKVPKFSDARKICCNLPKIPTKRPNLRVFHQKDAN